MRVDMKAAMEVLKGSGLLKYFREIEEMERYTHLVPPYMQEDAQALIERAQERLGMRFSAAYARFMRCCDGGALFTNQIYSLLCPEDAGNDLVEMNLYLRGAGLIPEGSAAVGETNYGAYIVQCASGRNAMGLWDAGSYIARYDGMAEWLEDVLEEARFLLSEDALEEIEAFETEVGADAGGVPLNAGERLQDEEGEMLFE